MDTSDEALNETSGMNPSVIFYYFELHQKGLEGNALCPADLRRSQCTQKTPSLSGLSLCGGGMHRRP